MTPAATAVASCSQCHRPRRAWRALSRRGLCRRCSSRLGWGW